MASEQLKQAVNNYEEYIKINGIDDDVINAYIQACQTAILREKDIKYGIMLTDRTKKLINAFVESLTGGTLSELEQYQQENKVSYEIIDKYYDVLRLEAPELLDSYCLYVEKNRPKKERFYEPRRKTLKLVVDKLQLLEDDELDELFVHMPPRIGKSQIMTMYLAWHCARNTEYSNLYCTYKESLGGAFLVGVIEIWTDPTYCHADIFPESKIVHTDSKNHKVDLNRKKKYVSLSGKGLESGLNGEYDAYGVLVIDDILEGVQDVMNPETLRRKQIVYNNNLMSRKKEKCKIVNNGTIWSLHDIYMNRINFLMTNPDARHIRWEVLKIPALDPVTDESNFDYDYGVGYSTQYYRTLRAQFEAEEDMAGWYAQYQQEPIERDGAVFNPLTLNYYNGMLPAEEPVKIVAACDVALGGKDFLSFPVAYVYEDDSVYIHDVVFDSSEKDITQPKVINAIINNNVGSAFFEANQGGEGYKDDIDRLLKENKKFNGGRGINLISKYAPTNKRKEQRIWDNAPTIRKFYFRDTESRSPEYAKFMQNLFRFTINGINKFDDAPDSLSSLADFIYKGSGVRTVVIMRGFL